MRALQIAVVAAIGVVPVAAQAENSTFSGKNAYGSLSAFGQTSIGYVEVSVSAFRNATRSSGTPETQSGADMSVYGYTDGGCFFGYGSTTDISFAALPGALSAKSVTASGSIPFVIYDCNTGIPGNVDTLTFSMKLNALSGQQYSSFGTSHSEYGDTRYNMRYDYTSSSASFDGSSVSTGALGPIEIVAGNVGQSKTHSVDIAR